MEQQNEHAPSFWCNYQAALLSGTLVAAIVNSSIFVLMSPFLPSAHFLPSEFSVAAILSFAIKSIATLAFMFVFVLTPSGVIAFVATLVFGSATLLLVRKTRFETVSTFAIAGFIVCYILLNAFTHVNSIRDALIAIVIALSGLAGGWAFGYRICFPVSTGCGSRPSPTDEPLLSRIVKFLLVR